MPKRLSKFSEAGRVLSDTNLGKLQTAATAIQSVISAHTSKMGSAGESVREADDSFVNRAATIQAALTASQPDGIDIDIVDLGDDWVVFSLEPSDDDDDDDLFDDDTLYQCSYTIDVNGAVTLGNRVQVIAQTTYRPANESERVTERDMQQLAGGKVDLDTVPPDDFAGKNKSFPIVSPGDVTAAAHAIGRAGSDNYSTGELKVRIIAIAKRKGDAFVAALPDSWKPSNEAFQPTALDLAAVTEILGDNGIAVEAGNEAVLIGSFGKWAADSQAECVSVLSGKAGISDPNALCFAPGTLVQTRDRGLIAIESLSTDDYVKTHRGRWQPVEGVICTNPRYSGDLLQINTQLSPEPLTVTPDHTVLAIRGPEFWPGTRTRKRNRNAYEAVGMPHEYRDPSKGEYYGLQTITQAVEVKAKDLKDSDYLVYPTAREIVDRPEVHDDMLRVLGWFAGDGHINRGRETILSLGYKDQSILDDFVAITERQYGAHTSAMDHADYAGGHCYQVKAVSKSLATFLHEAVGTGAAEKRFSPWVMQLPTDRLRLVLDAYWETDGHIRPNRNEAVATTISRELAIQIRDILLFVGERPRLRHVNRGPFGEIQGRTVRLRDAWIIEYSPNAKRSAGLQNDQYIALPIASIERVQHDGPVYDVQVAEDHTLCGLYWTAHNCAWLKDRYTGTTRWRGKGKESAEPITGDLVPLVEKAVAKDGTADICLITPGWGSSGHYSAEMLKRDGPKVFTAGCHMFLDHPSESEALDRPERSVKDLAATLATDAEWRDNGPNGPGLYAKANILPPLSGVLDALAPHIGVSIRASGEAQEGEADGKRGRIINKLVNAASVDFVTKAGRGGKVLPLMESLRNGQSITATEDTVDLSEAQTKIASLEAANTSMQTELSRLRERALIGDATALVNEQLRPVRLADVTKQRLAAQLTSNPPTKDGELDRESLAEAVKAAVEAEAAYLSAVLPTGRISGLGASQPVTEASEADIRKQMEQEFVAQGMSESAARVAAAM